METTQLQQHWENIYRTKQESDLSWYQPVPALSIDFVRQFDLPQSAAIIDVGGGDSHLVDHLLEKGYSNITVLDISETALERAKARLGSRARQVKWIVADALHFIPEEEYDLWHDRAAFHFLTGKEEVDAYVRKVHDYIRPQGFLVLGTFSEAGPQKCSGLPVRQYSENSMNALLKRFFMKIRCITVDHLTPFNTMQNFLFCSFRNMKIG